MAILEVEHLEKRFGGTPVLQGVAFSLEQGQTLAILGSSGSGKTPLLRSIEAVSRQALRVLRLFGGALFRVTESERSSVPQLLKVRFIICDVGVMGGLGCNIRKFFIDFRISGYPRSRVWHDFTSEGIARRVKVPHDIVYGGSL